MTKDEVFAFLILFALFPRNVILCALLDFEFPSRTRINGLYDALRRTELRPHLLAFFKNQMKQEITEEDIEECLKNFDTLLDDLVFHVWQTSSPRNKWEMLIMKRHKRNFISAASGYYDKHRRRRRKQTYAAELPGHLLPELQERTEEM